MSMGTQLLRTAALLIILSMAPAAAARQPAAGAKRDRSNCPQDGARAGAANASPAPAPAASGKVTKITLPDRVSGPLFNLARRSSAFDL
jgi:hypothetical protein